MRKISVLFICFALSLHIVVAQEDQPKKKVEWVKGRTETREVLNEAHFTICPDYKYKRLGAFVGLEDAKVAACAMDDKEDDKIVGINYLDFSKGIDTVKFEVKIEEADLDKIRFKQPIKVISPNISLTQKYIIVQHEKKGLAIHNVQDGTLLRYIPIPVYSDKITYHINKSGEVLFIQDTDISGKFFDLSNGEILSEVIAPEGTQFTGAFKFMRDSRKYLVGFKPIPGYTKKKVKSTVKDTLDIFDPSETIRMEELFLNQVQYPKEQYKTGLVFGEVANNTANLPKIINDSIPDFIATRHILFARHDSLIVTIHSNGIVMMYELQNNNYYCRNIISSLLGLKLFKGFMNPNSNTSGVQFRFSRMFRPDVSVKNVINAALSNDGHSLFLNNRAYTVTTPSKKIALDAKTGITVMNLPSGDIQGFFMCDNRWVGVSFATNTYDTDMHFTDDDTAFFSKGKAYSFRMLKKLLEYQAQLDPTKTIEVQTMVPVVKDKN